MSEEQFERLKSNVGPRHRSDFINNLLDREFQVAAALPPTETDVTPIVTAQVERERILAWREQRLASLREERTVMRWALAEEGKR